MQRYVSILRGINVSGQKRIKMDDLTALYESLGFTNVHTYIQSGNVVFDAAGKKAGKITSDIEQAIQRHYGFEVPVQLRTSAEMSTTVKANPFLKEKKIDIGKLHVTFLEQVPEKSSVQNFNPGPLGSDRYVIQGAEIYLYCPGGYGKTKLSNNFIEKQFGVRATTRNWKTVNVLADMVNGTVPGEK
ncbi:MAG: DUF1697 domain-containing protein [Acidiferrobacterales bacterium]